MRAEERLARDIHTLRPSLHRLYAQLSLSKGRMAEARNPVKEAELAFRAVRHLKPSQVVAFIESRIRNQFSRYRCKGGGEELLPVLMPQLRARFVPPRASRDCRLGPTAGQAFFLNRGRKVGWPPDWNQSDVPKLWNYNLHYHDYIWGLNVEHAMELARSWIRGHPLRRDAHGWKPYPLSVRLGNWVKYFLGAHYKETCKDRRFFDNLVRSMAAQAKWLLRSLEFHLLANHLFENAVALCLVGSFFGGPLAQRCQRRGWGILRKELPEQILGDGGHFERSAMYHCRVLYSLCDLYNVSEQRYATLIEPYLRKMCIWLAHHCHPDGQIVLFNDAGTNIYLSPKQLLQYVARIAPTKALFVSDAVAVDGPFACAETGHYGWRSSDGTYIVCDAGPIGPDYQPGHAHADIFTFEMSIRRHRVIVDSGTYDYQRGTSRRFTRSTAAHNTIELDGQDQCELWGAFRVARRGRPRDVEFLPYQHGFSLKGWHDGYRRLGGNPRHGRGFYWDRAGILTIRDEVTSKRRHKIVSRLHFHPDCAFSQPRAQTVQVWWPTGRARLEACGYDEMTLGKYCYSPEFGLQIPAPCVSFRATGSNASLELWFKVL